MDEGLNVAGLWLNGGQTVVNTIDRTGGITAFNILNEASPMTQVRMWGFLPYCRHLGLVMQVSVFWTLAKTKY